MTSASPSSDLMPWLTAFVAERARPDQVDSWVDRVTTAILRDMPEVARLEDLPAYLRTTVREHWVAFIGDIVQPEQHFHLPDAARRFSIELAQRQLPLESLVRIYRVAQQEVWLYISEVVRDLASADFDRADVLLHFWNRAGVWLDESITSSIEFYQAERARVIAGADAQRFETVRAVLEGDTDDVRRISSALGGYPMSAHHTAMALACDDDEDSVARLEQVAHELARSVGASNPLLVRPGGRRLWAWIATRDRIEPAPLVAAFGASERGSIVVGLGTASHGVHGFIDSHTEACGALQVIASQASAGIATYDDVALLVLLGCSEEVDRFMVRTLGGLVGDDESSQRIRETVAAFLGSGGSVDEASRQLCVHRNTIRYRLGQAEEMLGRPITKISTEVAVALRHHASFH